MATDAGACARRYQGHVSAALVLGGVDFSGPHLFTVQLLSPKCLCHLLLDMILHDGRVLC